jgi:osmotically-inducible protein OsmY
LRPLSGEFKNTVPGDKGIQERVLAEIDRQGWSPGMSVNVIVRDGVVELWGTILDERVREGLRVAAENVPGVKQVKDHLIWIELMSGMRPL